MALRRLMDLKTRPTALLVANPYHYLAVVSRLAQIGLRVPQDVSVLSRDDDAFLAFVSPVPARYLTTAHVMAKSLLRPVLELLKDGAVIHREMSILPEFVRGDSLGAPPLPGPNRAG